MKLELKKEEIIPYLPFDLKVMDLYDSKESFFVGYSINHTEPLKVSVYRNELSTGRLLSEIKPILRPLSDLIKGTDKIDYEAELEELFGHLELTNRGAFHFVLDGWTTWKDYHKVISKLFEWHFDVFGLIEKGLAIDINTIKK